MEVSEKTKTQRLPLHLLVVLLLMLVLIACAPAVATPTVAPPPTATPVPSATRLLPTATQTPAPAPSPTAVPEGSVHPPDRRTGIADVDAVIEAVLADDLAARRALIGYLTTPCTTALGMGGPPKCQAGESDGTMVEVFPILGQEGEFVRREAVDSRLDFAAQGLYAVYRIPGDAYEEAYWPAGEYGILFIDRREGLTVTAHVSEGRMVRLDLQRWPAAVLVAREAGELLLPPPGWTGTGTLEGHVTIGPLVPVQHEGTPEPTPGPEVWLTRAILIFAEDGQTEVAVAGIDAQGNYRVVLPAGSYVVNVIESALEHGVDLPKTVVVVADQVTRLDVEIDTGIR
jgi:hypothetical protein